MQTAKVTILKYVLFMIITKINSYVMVSFDNLKEEELVGNVINTLHENNVDNNLRFRKNIDSNGYVDRKLVKRIIPHGYEIKNFEYDNKFKTVYKPLVRVHKKKPNGTSSKNGNRYEVIFVLDNNHYNDIVNLAKDDAFLEPFTTNKADVTYFPDNEDLKHITDDNEKHNFENPKSNKHEIVEKLDDKTTNIEKTFDNINLYDLVVYGSLKQLLRHQEKNLKNDKYEQQNSDKYKISNQLKLPGLKKLKGSNDGKANSPNRPDEPKNKGLQWFVPIGKLISKQLNKNKPTKLTGPNHSYNDHPDSINHFREENAIKDKRNKKTNLNSLFRSVSQLYSKHLKKKHRNSVINNDNFNKKLNYDVHKPNSLKVQILRLTEKEKPHEKKRLFHTRKPGLIKKDPKESFDVIKLLKDKTKFKETNEIKSDKFKLLNEIAKLKANNQKEAMANILRLTLDPRSSEHVMEGEEATTKKPDVWMPNYPFWNYWTYEKTIYQDECKFPMILHGRLCIEPIT